ncbi:MAG: adenosine deaminase family protein [Archangium sp.]|nr:adenosine deaminase family protein [Archangium sp.]
MFADLHRHLDGSLREQTVRELAGQLGLNVPAALRFHAGMGLDEALSKFAFTLSLLQTPHAVERVAREICEDAVAEGVSTLEIRFAPQLHLQKGARLEEIIDAATSGAAGRAGIILCGLYGEPVSQLLSLVDAAATRPAVVALDLAGGPAPFHTVRLADYAPAFTRARQLGLGRTVHASEGRPAEEIRIAIESLHAQRIGHGTTLLEDPRVVELVLERGVTIEACPTSNVHVGAVARVEDHPIAKWLERGIKCCINTDNTLLSAVDAREEHRRVAAIPGMTEARVQQAIAHGHAARFSR